MSDYLVKQKTGQTSSSVIFMTNDQEQAEAVRDYFNDKHQTDDYWVEPFRGEKFSWAS